MLIDEIKLPLKITPVIETIILDDGNIKQSIAVEFNNTFQQVSCMVYNLAEDGVKASLIKLGWKPPEDKE